MTQEIILPPTKKLSSFYPFPKFRNGIEEALDKVDAAVAAGKRFICMDVKTGGGKSAIATSWSRKYGCTIITPTKLLQQQYAGTAEFDREYVVFGKSNYQCGLDKIKTTMVDEAICCSDAVTKANKLMIPWNDSVKFWALDVRPSKALKKKCALTNTCPYYSLIEKIGRKPGAVLNYDLFVHVKGMPDGRIGLDRNSYVAMDEAHQLLSKIKSVFGYKINNTSAVRVLGDEAERQTGEPPVQWMHRICSIGKKLLKEETDPKTANSLISFNNRLEKILEFDISHAMKFHIDDNFEEIEIKPLDFRHLKEALFYPYKHVLFLSATFPSNFCELLGISNNEVEFIDVPSTFEPKKRPAIVIKGMQVINHQTVLDDKHTAKIAMDLILQEHINEKGIVHCSNYKFFNQLRQLYRGNKRFLWVDRNDDKSEMLEKHSRSKLASILVSPSMMEGVDLKDDLARFQILLKLPFASLDDYTRKMMGVFPNYYENLTITSIIQAYGRAVRSEEDYAKFYILDGSINRLLNQHKKLFSKYFMEALCSLTMV